MSLECITPIVAMCVLLSAVASAQGTTKAFPAGWNGMARTPPLGWRSWNAFGNRITQDMMLSAMDELTAKTWNVDGKQNVSLADVGYASVGIDEGWEGCGQGSPGNRFHDANGFPVINSKFPDMKGLVDQGHAKGLKVGWYLNGCACGERKEVTKQYIGDIKRLHDFGFDGVKFDGCGAEVNMTFYAELMQESGKNYTIENCHWGNCGAFKGNADGSSCPTVDWSPFNWYRTSGDINAGAMSWFGNLQTARKFLEHEPPLSRPGSWAYPDMLEVGRVQGSVEWNRAHFGAWVIISAPLILGLDLSKTHLLAPIIPFITNPEAIAVNQQWQGHPGRLVEEFSPSSNGKFVSAKECSDTPAQKGWKYDSKSKSVKVDGGCLDAALTSELEVKPCTGADTQKFTYDSAAKTLKLVNGKCVDANDWTKGNVWIYACNDGTNQQVEFIEDGSVCDACHESRKRCWEVTSENPNAGGNEKVQVWAKPQPNGAMAVLVINPSSQDFTVSLDVSKLGLSGTIHVRDIWSRKDVGEITSTITMKIAPTDSQFYLLSPKTFSAEYV